MTSVSSFRRFLKNSRDGRDVETDLSSTSHLPRTIDLFLKSTLLFHPRHPLSTTFDHPLKLSPFSTKSSRRAGKVRKVSRTRRSCTIIKSCVFPSSYLSRFSTESFHLSNVLQRTVQQLLIQELAPAQIVSPSYLPLLDVSDEPYYFSPSTGSINRNPPTFEAPRGGILCEEMGAGQFCFAISSRVEAMSFLDPLLLSSTDINLFPSCIFFCIAGTKGKTLQTLSLILSTLSHLPSPPLSLPPQTSSPLNPHSGVQPLEQLCRHILRTHPLCARHPLEIDSLDAEIGGVWSILKSKEEEKRAAWYLIEGGGTGVEVGNENGTGAGGSRGRRGSRVVPLGQEGVGSGSESGRNGRKRKKVWLGWGTLVTVPDHLLQQWEAMMGQRSLLSSQDSS